MSRFDFTFCFAFLFFSLFACVGTFLCSDTHAGQGSFGATGYSSVYFTNFPSCSLSLPAGGSWFQCSSSQLATETSCSMQCLVDYIQSGSSYSCVKGRLQGGITCQCPALADARVPLHGIKSGCSSILSVGQSCSTDCTLPYIKSGANFQCGGSSGIVTGSQTCLPPCEGAPTTTGLATWSLASPVTTAPHYPVGTAWTLTCPSGVSAINSPMLCGTNSQYDYNTFCLDLRMEPRLSVDLTTMSPYSGLVTWGNVDTDALNLPASRFTFRYQPTLVFPVSTGPDRQESPLSGVRFSAGSSWVSTGSTRAAQLTSDDNAEIEHARYAMVIEATYTDPNTHQVTVGQQTTNSISLPCSCNQQGALQQTLIDATDALMFGTPLDPEVQQAFDDSNVLLLRFMPNSLCSDAYTIYTSSDPNLPAVPDVDGNPVTIDVLSMQVTQLHVENAQSCGFLVKQSEAFTQVSYPLPGRPLQVCIQPLPRLICTTCTSSYGTLLAEGEKFGKMPTTCVSYTPNFVVYADGKVTTPLTTFSREAIPVPGVTVTMQVLNSDKSVMYVPSQQNAQVLVPLQVSVVTDVRGRYAITLASQFLPNEAYTLRLVPFKQDHTDTGMIYNHSFSVRRYYFQSGVLQACGVLPVLLTLRGGY
jgi:hypothetical protein